ncbi:MAG: cytochrome c [Rhodospirillaceae bacterium]|nr:cytochrome c [Rhodospirillaceae bacterium]
MIDVNKSSAVHAAIVVRAALFILALAFMTFMGFPKYVTADEIERGRYIFDLAGCAGCHTDKKSKGAFLGGGRKFETEFGTFYSPNITPDPNSGIGKWGSTDFIRAMREGISPDGFNYYPSFPYTSYNKITDDDLKALWAYLQSVPPVAQINISHNLTPPFNWRFLISIWKLINFNQTPFTPEQEKTAAWNRGRYIIEALSHCRECHTPRNIIGGLDITMDYAGTEKNPEGIVVPNITTDRDTGIGKWTKGDIDMLLTMGMLPNNDFVGGVMAESVTHSTSKMTPDDKSAVIEYLGQIRPIINPIKRKKSANSGESWQ